MPIINQKKYSKSEIIHILTKGNPSFLKNVLESKNIRLPKTLIFGENYNVEEIKEMILKNKFTGFYSYFKLKKNNIVSELNNVFAGPLNIDSVKFNESLELLKNETNTRLFKALNNISSDIIDKSMIDSIIINTDMSDSNKIFILSILRRLDIDNQFIYIEDEILKLLFKNQNNSCILKLCKIKLSKITVKNYIEMNFYEPSKWKIFLKKISHKLSTNIVELWFEKDYENTDLLKTIEYSKTNGFLKQINVRNIQNSWKSKAEIFKDLSAIKIFKKIFTRKIENIEYASFIYKIIPRSDILYLLRNNNKNRSVNVEKDYKEFNFFDRILELRYFKSNFIKIFNYLVNYGYSLAFDLFITGNILFFLENATKHINNNLIDDNHNNNNHNSNNNNNINTITTEFIITNNISTKEKQLIYILIEILKNNNNIECNEIIFKEMKKNENIFRKIYKYFCNTTDITLFKLLEKDFDIKVEDLLGYINFGYETELLECFYHKLSNEEIAFEQSKVKEIDDVYINKGFNINLYETNKLNKTNILDEPIETKSDHGKDIDMIFESINGWNLEFFMKLFANYSCKSESTFQFYISMNLLNILNNFENLINLKTLNINRITELKRNITKIYCNTILKCNNKYIFEKIPFEFKLFYLQNNPGLILDFIESVDKFCTLKDAVLLFKARNIINYEKCINNNEKLSNVSNIKINEKLSNDSNINNEKCINYNEKLLDSSNINNEKSLDDCGMEYKHAMFKDLFIDENDLINCLFNIMIIREEDFNYLFVLYFDKILEIMLSSHTKDDLINDNEFNLNILYETVEETVNYNFFEKNIKGSLDKLIQILKKGLKNKLNIYILNDNINEILISDLNITKKIAILKYLDSSLLVSENILSFINNVVPLLNSSNYMICKLAKLSLSNIKFETSEIQNILPEIINSFTNAKNFNSFLENFKMITFNNYLCFNSLNLIVQLLFKNINENVSEILRILSKIIAIIKDKDFRDISNLIFINIGKFVLNSNFNVTEALEVASQFCLYVQFEDFNSLLTNLDSQNVCYFVKGILKIKNDSLLTDMCLRSNLFKNNNSNRLLADNILLDENNLLIHDTNLLIHDNNILGNNSSASNILGNNSSASNILGKNSSANNILGKNSPTNNLLENKCLSISPAFLSYFSELPEFMNYLDLYLPVTLKYFNEPKAEPRLLASKALKNILEFTEYKSQSHLQESKTNTNTNINTNINTNTNTNTNIDINTNTGFSEYKLKIQSHLISAMLKDDFSIRLASLDILENIENALPIIFIARSDSHSLVRKKAQDIWKEKVYNTNTLLRSIYRNVLDFIDISNKKNLTNGCFSEAIQGTIKEMFVKYITYLEQYVNDYNSSKFAKKYIFLETLKYSSKLLDNSILFLKENFNAELFLVLYRKNAIDFSTLSEFDAYDLISIAKLDSTIAYNLFIKLEIPELINYLTTSQKIELLKLNSGKSCNLSPCIIYMLETIEISPLLEKYLLGVNSVFSYHYLKNLNLIDHGVLTKLWQKVFENCNDLDGFINMKNIKYIKECSIDNVIDKKRLISLLINFDDKTCFRLLTGIIEKFGDELIFENDSSLLFKILGYLLYNNISINRQADAYKSICFLYHRYKHIIGFFRCIIETSVLKI